MIGQTLSHYKILDKLGEGGMGEVYLAEDTTLKRKVALKVLPADLAASQERLERFQREAEALAALDHPNIVTIHTVEEAEGTRFLTMQLVDGKPLSELIPPNGMALEQIFKIATPLADALASAHEKGIIHRDLKPANVMVTTEDRVKVLDFGLAKLSHDPSLVSTQLATEPLTQDGLILGTMPYMSPEQLQGKELDGRSDVFSLGVMLYEMATGERPFKGDTSATLIMSIGRDTAPEVDTVRAELPHHLGRVIGRCLKKDSDKRFQTIKDVRNEFAALKRETDSGVTSASRIDVPQVDPRKRAWWPALVAAGLVVAALGSWLLVREPEPGAQTSGVVRNEDVAETQAASTDATEAATGSDRKMIVVLPFENLGSSEDDYFAAGMTEEITSRLAMVSGMGVISRNSAVRYADTDKSMQEIGAELGVDYVLEGTVRWAKEGDSSRVRITPQLIQVSDDTHLWADTYDRVIQDVFAIQTEIAESVITELGISLLETERQSLAVKPTDNPAAYRAFLQAEEEWRYPQDWDHLTRAVDLFARATDLDPSFVEAWARRSQLAAWHILVFSDRQGEDPVRRLAEADEFLARAEAIDPDHPLVRLARGYVAYWGRREYEPALEEFQALQELRPNDAEVTEAIGYIFRRQGKVREAVEQMTQAFRLNPSDYQNLTVLAGTIFGLREWEEAERWYDKVIELEPGRAPGYLGKSWAIFCASGDIAASRSVLESAPVPAGEIAGGLWTLANYERDFEQALSISRSQGWKTTTGIVLLRVGREEEGRRELQERLEEIEAQFEASPKTVAYHLERAHILGDLGRIDEAFAEATRAWELGREDRWMSPVIEELLAGDHMLAGRHDEALDLIEDLLEKHYEWPLTVHDLRLRPLWDPLRDDPRFQALLEKHGQSER